MPVSKMDQKKQSRLEQIFCKELVILAGNPISQNLIPKIYFIGIKGTGMCALAQLLHHFAYRISGSDVTEHFYTDELLEASKIHYFQGFSVQHLPDDCDLVIYSAAYDRNNPEYAEAERRSNNGNLLMLSYPQALGFISHIFTDCIAVAGVHGKTTSTLLCSALIKSLGYPGAAIAGAGAPHLDGNAFLFQGTEILTAETCEYRNHFFHFQPSIVLLTSLEWDHQDFFTDYSMMEQSFRKFIEKDSIRSVVYCADESALCSLINNYQQDLQNRHSGTQLGKRKSPAELPSPEFIPYGFTATGDFAVAATESAAGQTTLQLAGYPAFPLRLCVPGEHLALNALGTLAALYQSQWVKCQYASFSEFLQQAYSQIDNGLQLFRGASRRSEQLGKILLQGHSNPEDAVLVLDDYAHHPTALRKTLAGYKRFYPQHRLVVDFMSHTYSRTESLHCEFSECFQDADVLILHDIYASARELQNTGYNGQTLWQSVNDYRKKQGQEAALFSPQPLDAIDTLAQILRPRDLFITMGAGSNRELALALLKKYRSTEWQ